MAKREILLSWSSGKDSAWALHLLRQSEAYRVVGLLTTINEAFDRVAMHAVRRDLLELQAERAGLELWPVLIPFPCTNEQYDDAMRVVTKKARLAGIQGVAFGDLFLEDVRRYREERMALAGLEPVFPLWGEPTDALARRMISAGLRAVITCVDPRVLDRSFAGRLFDSALLADLPAGVDPCGENGEFHTFVHAGPMFRQPIAIETGEVVERDGFVFADVLPSVPAD